MRTTLIAVISVLALITFSQATPSFRALQQNTTAVSNLTGPANITANGSNSTVGSNTTGSSNVTVNSTNSTNGTAAAANPYPGYTQLSVADSYNNQSVNNAFIHGINAIVQTAIAQGKVPVSVYNITQWQGAWARRVRGGVNYIFRAHLVSASGVNFDTNVTVFSSNSGTNSLIAYNFRANNISRNLFPANNYRWLTPAQVHNNTIVQGALVYGAKTMVEYLINNKKIPALNLNYTIYNLYLAAYKRVTGGTSYRFQIDAQSGDGIQLRTNYTVFYNSSDKSYNETQYWYRAWNFNSSDIDFGNSSNSTNSTSNVTVVNNSTDNSTGASNVTVVDNSTSAANATAAGNVTDANATTGSNSTSNDTTPVIAPVALNVNINASLITADNTTNRSTALIYENAPPSIIADNSTALGSQANTTTTNSGILSNSTNGEVNGGAQ